MLAQILFWTALGLILWTYVGFPLVLVLRGALFPRPVRKAPITPHVSVIVVAHNEVATIGAKLESILALDYPGDRLEILVASDGSSDGTDELVAAHAARGVRLLALPRAGKIPALNTAVSHATGDILVFSDANSLFARNAVRELVAPFADSTVGAVGGNQCYLPDGDHAGGAHVASFGERMYWNFDRILKLMQSRAGSMIGATGAIHAIRRGLFRPVPLGVSDDFVISTGAIAQGYRLVFEPRAIASETVSPSPAAEFGRKRRVIVRGLRALWAIRALFKLHQHGFYSVQLASHKLLRWSICWLLLVLFIASLSLAGSGAVYRLAALGQLAFYLCAAVAPALRRTPLTHFRAFRVMSLPYFFCLANYAALRAWLQLLAGKRIDVWDSQRSATRALTTPAA